MIRQRIWAFLFLLPKRADCFVWNSDAMRAVRAKRQLDSCPEKQWGLKTKFSFIVCVLSHFNMGVDLRMMCFNLEIKCGICLLLSRDYQAKYTEKKRGKSASICQKCDWHETEQEKQVRVEKTSSSSKLISHNGKSAERLTTADHRQSETQYPYGAVLCDIHRTRSSMSTTAALHLLHRPNK